MFLILICVALFAALALAVTYSSRDQPDSKSDASVLSAGELNQYPSTIRVAIMSMIISNSIKPEDLEFNPPADLASLTSPGAGVFHPDGGNATYTQASPPLMASGQPGTWHYNGEFEIEGVNSSVASNFSGNEIIAFLPGVRQAVCEKINENSGIGKTIPDTSADLSGSYTIDMVNGYALPAGEVILGPAGGNGTDQLVRHVSGCFRNNGGNYVFYQVLLER